MQRERPYILFGLNESGFSWKGVLALAVIFFGAVLFAALLSPLVYFGVVAWAKASPDTIPGWLSSRMAPEDFPRYFDRVRWVPVVLALPWLFKWTRLLSLYRLGYDHPVRGIKTVARWWLLGMGMLLLVALLQWAFVGMGVSDQFSGGYLFEKLAMGLLAGLVVALLEELLFRGVILRLFYTALRPWPAIILSALFFAYVHFKSVPWPQGQEVHWYSGLDVAWRASASVVLQPEWWKFLSLFGAGVFLNLLFLRSGSLWPCVGVHAGWVAFRVVYTKFFQVDAGQAQWFWGSQTMLDGLLPVLPLALFCLWLVIKPGPRPT